MSFEYEFVSARALSFGLCSCNGDFWCNREADSGKFVLFLPSQGKASLERGKETFEGAPGNGLLFDGAVYNNVRFVGPRQHLVMIIEQKEMISRLHGMLEAPVQGSLDFAPLIYLTWGTGLVLKNVAELTFSGLMRDATPITARLVEPHQYHNQPPSGNRAASVFRRARTCRSVSGATPHVKPARFLIAER